MSQTYHASRPDGVKIVIKQHTAPQKHLTLACDASWALAHI